MDEVAHGRGADEAGEVLEDFGSVLVHKVHADRGQRAEVRAELHVSPRGSTRQHGKRCESMEGRTKEDEGKIEGWAVMNWEGRRRTRNTNRGQEGLHPLRRGGIDEDRVQLVDEGGAHIARDGVALVNGGAGEEKGHLGKARAQIQKLANLKKMST